MRCGGGRGTWRGRGHPPCGGCLVVGGGGGGGCGGGGDVDPVQLPPRKAGVKRPDWAAVLEGMLVDRRPFETAAVEVRRRRRRRRSEEEETLRVRVAKGRAAGGVHLRLHRSVDSTTRRQKPSRRSSASERAKRQLQPRHDTTGNRERVRQHRPTNGHKKTINNEGSRPTTRRVEAQKENVAITTNHPHRLGDFFVLFPFSRFWYDHHVGVWCGGEALRADDAGRD